MFTVYIIIHAQITANSGVSPVPAPPTFKLLWYPRLVVRTSSFARKLYRSAQLPRYSACTIYAYQYNTFSVRDLNNIVYNARLQNISMAIIIRG